MSQRIAPSLALDLGAESRRQQALLAAILRRDASDIATLLPMLRDHGAGEALLAIAGHGGRGLVAYRANAQASAERALAAAYPTVAELLGSEAFASLARAHLYAQPPTRGDLACWGEGLPTFIAQSALLAGEPYLADVARLDWASHRAEAAADHDDAVRDLQRLADTDPARLHCVFAPGVALVASAHPIVAIRQAHRVAAGEREAAFAAVREALAQGRGETAWVWRQGWVARVAALRPGEGAFLAALTAGASLADAFSRTDGHADFDFQDWLTRALSEGWLAAVITNNPSEENQR